jgi:hypothetical protein
MSFLSFIATGVTCLSVLMCWLRRGQDLLFCVGAVTLPHAQVSERDGTRTYSGPSATRPWTDVCLAFRPGQRISGSYTELVGIPPACRLREPPCCC